MAALPLPLPDFNVIANSHQTLSRELGHCRNLPAIQGGNLILEELRTIRNDMVRQIGALRNDMDQQIVALRNDVGQQIGALRNDMGQQIGALRNDLGQQIGALQAEMRGEFGGIQGTVGEIQQEIALTKDLIVASVQVMLSKELKELK
ncbi:MAG: hypothetical protein Q9163_003488 [Psora crenata]